MRCDRRIEGHRQREDRDDRAVVQGFGHEPQRLEPCADRHHPLTVREVDVAAAGSPRCIERYAAVPGPTDHSCVETEPNSEPNSESNPVQNRPRFSPK